MKLAEEIEEVPSVFFPRGQGAAGFVPGTPQGNAEEGGGLNMSNDQILFLICL